MTRTTLAALLAVVMAGAAPANSDVKESTLAKEVQALREEVAALRRMRELDSRLNATEMELLTKRVERIEKSLKELADRAGTYRSEFTPSRVAPPRPGTGTIKLDNRLGVTAYVTIDGISYSIAPMSVRTLAGRPTGTISYSTTADGFGIGPLTRTPLLPGETLTLTIY